MLKGFNLVKMKFPAPFSPANLYPASAALKITGLALLPNHPSTGLTCIGASNIIKIIPNCAMAIQERQPTTLMGEGIDMLAQLLIMFTHNPNYLMLSRLSTYFVLSKDKNLMLGVKYGNPTKPSSINAAIHQGANFIWKDITQPFLSIPNGVNSFKLFCSELIHKNMHDSPEAVTQHLQTFKTVMPILDAKDYSPSHITFSQMTLLGTNVPPLISTSPSVKLFCTIASFFTANLSRRTMFTYATNHENPIQKNALRGSAVFKILSDATQWNLLASLALDEVANLFTSVYKFSRLNGGVRLKNQSTNSPIK